jgi:hypothetical protein
VLPDCVHSFCHEAWGAASRQSPCAHAASAMDSRGNQAPVQRSDFAFKIVMDEFAVAISTFDPALVMGDLQPDPWMAQGTLAAVTGNAVGVYDPGFGRILAHGGNPWLWAVWRVLCPMCQRGTRPSWAPVMRKTPLIGAQIDQTGRSDAKPPRKEVHPTPLKE